MKKQNGLKIINQNKVSSIRTEMFLAEKEQRDIRNKKFFKEDTFIKKWYDNYNNNLEHKVFSESRCKPLKYLMTTKPYSNIPIVIISAGPSLTDSQLQTLKEYQNKCLIICVDTILFKLLENSIVPDFTCTVDPDPEICCGFRKESGEWHDTSNLMLVAPVTTSMSNINAWKGKIIFYNTSDNHANHKGKFLEKLTIPTAGFGEIFNSFFVGATMLQYSSIFNPSNILLLGYDFAYSGGMPFSDGVIHRKAHYQIYYDTDKERLERHKKDLTTVNLNNKNLEVEVDGKKVDTNNLFKLYKDTFVELVKKYRFQDKVINCTGGGILVEYKREPIKDSLEKYCKEEIKKVDVFNMPVSRKKRFKKRH